MDTKLLLVKAITLLCLESYIPGKGGNSAEMVSQAMATIKVPESFHSGDFGRDPIIALRETARWMTTNPVDYTYDKSELLQRIRVNTGTDEQLFDAFKDGITPERGEEELKKVCGNYRYQLRIFLEQKEVKALAKNFYTKLHFNEQMVDWRTCVPEMIEQLTRFKDMEGAQVQNRSIVRSLRMSDPTSVADALRRGVEELDSKGTIRFGHQGINRMFGPAGGARRGEMIVIGAQQHNYKSGMALQLLKGAALYNKPYMRDPEKRPMLFRISCENELETDIMHLYRLLAEAETGLPVDVRSVNPDEAAQYVYENLTRSGYELDMVRIDPSDFTFHDLFLEVEKREQDGFEIHMCNVDYLSMISKKGCQVGPAGVEVRDLYRRTRNFMSKRGITFITPHQLSTESKQLTRSGVSDFVKQIANQSYWEGSKQIDQEVDMEIYLHIEIVNGEKYLTIQRGKHRSPLITPERDLYCVYKFDTYADIPDDVLDLDRSRRHVGGTTMAQGGEAPWYAGM